MFDAPILLENVSENRDAFIALRQDRIGASDIGTILGLNKYQTPLDLWMQKTGRKDPIEDNDRLWYGREHEPIVAKLFGRKFGADVAHVNKVYQHPTIPYLIVSPDYVARMPNGEHRLLECKTVGFGLRDSWSETEAPSGAIAQLQGQQSALQVMGGHCCAIVAGNVFESYFPYCEFNQALWEGTILPKLEEFYACMTSDTPPAAVAGDVELLNEMYPTIQSSEPLDDCVVSEIEELIAKYGRWKAIKKESVEKWDDAIDSIKARLRQLIENREQVVVSNGAIKVSKVHVKGYEVPSRVDTRFTVKVK